MVKLKMNNHDDDKINFQYIKKAIETLEKKEGARPAPKMLTFIVTWFYTGKFIIAPGTIGSIASYPLYYFIVNKVDSLFEAQVMLLLMALFLTIIGSLAIDRYQHYTKTHDDQSIVIDEVAGMMVILGISLKFLPLLSVTVIPYFWWFNTRDLAFIIALLIFRVFDIIKPFGIGYIDKRVKGGFGVMLDDILAGVYGAAFIYFSNMIVVSFFLK